MTFAGALSELHGLVGRTIVVGVHVGSPDAFVQLAGFAGRLLGADEVADLVSRAGVDPDVVPDIVSFEVVGGTPARGQSRFNLARTDFRSARWRESLLGRELQIVVHGGALTIAVDPHESENDPG